MLKISLGCLPSLVECIGIVQLSCVHLGNVTDGLRYNYASASLEDPMGGQSEIDCDLKGQSGDITWPVCKQFLGLLQVCWYCLAGREKCF